MVSVSVLVPIYNAQPFLRQCLESLRCQTLEDIEILCINDGSTDDSLDVIREFASADERFVVIDKPNGGYGHSLNCGIARSRGLYIGVVEPDDFVHPDMFKDLLSFAEYDGPAADIVKGSYWEFYDGVGELGNQLEKPNLAKEMGSVPQRLSLADDTTIIQHHPSIWSAIYRKSFLDEKGIRFVEPKGAGWADNPFMIETMVTADSIVWVPKPYYYYRQTNPTASSLLKDYHMPFDRMREMDAALRRLNASDGVWAAFYQREFYYMESIVGEFGFEERNPELRALVYEALERMDSSIVLTSDIISPQQMMFYDTRLKFAKGDWEDEVPERLSETENQYATVNEGGSNHLQADAVDAEPLVTYIVVIENSVRTARRAIESIVAQPIDSFEALFVDCASTDCTLDICRRFIRSDARMRLLGSADSREDALNNALAAARGVYVYVFDLGYRFVGNSFARSLLAAAEQNVDVMLLDSECRFSTDALNASGSVQPYARWGADDESAVSTRPFSAQDCARFALNCFDLAVLGALVKREVIQSANVSFEVADYPNCRLFLARSLMRADSIAYTAAPYLEEVYVELNPVPFYLDIYVRHFPEAPRLTEAALAIANDEEVADAFALSVKNLVLESFMNDMAKSNSLASIDQVCQKWFNEVDQVVGGQPTEQWAHDGQAYSEFTRIRDGGAAGYTSWLYLIYRRKSIIFDRTINEMFDSKTYKLGKAMKEAVSTVLPTRAIARIRESIASAN